MARRPMRALEDDVMIYLWAVGRPSTAADVQQTVAPELAYTTINTVLTRLVEKGRLDRHRAGRSFTYAPIRTEAEARAATMTSTLDHAADRSAVLSQFVGSLDRRDLTVLRELLESGE